MVYLVALLPFFLMPFIVLWLGHRISPTISWAKLLGLCAISTVLERAALHLMFSTDLPILGVLSRYVLGMTQIEFTEYQMKGGNYGWMLRYLSEHYGWVGSILWFWLVWLGIYLHRRKPQPQPVL